MHILVRALEEYPGVAGLPSTEDCGSALTKTKSEKRRKRYVSVFPLHVDMFPA